MRSEPDKRTAPLHEAAALVEALPAEMRLAGDVRKWRARILKTQQGAG